MLLRKTRGIGDVFWKIVAGIRALRSSSISSRTPSDHFIAKSRPTSPAPAATQTKSQTSRYREAIGETRANADTICGRRQRGRAIMLIILARMSVSDPSNRASFALPLPSDSVSRGPGPRDRTPSSTPPLPLFARRISLTQPSFDLFLQNLLPPSHTRTTTISKHSNNDNPTYIDGFRTCSSTLHDRLDREIDIRQKRRPQPSVSQSDQTGDDRILTRPIDFLL